MHAPVHALEIEFIPFPPNLVGDPYPEEVPVTMHQVFGRAGSLRRNYERREHVIHLRGLAGKEIETRVSQFLATSTDDNLGLLTRSIWLLFNPGNVLNRTVSYADTSA